MKLKKIRNFILIIGSIIVIFYLIIIACKIPTFYQNLITFIVLLAMWVLTISGFFIEKKIRNKKKNLL